MSRSFFAARALVAALLLVAATASADEKPAPPAAAELKKVQRDQKKQLSEQLKATDRPSRVTLAKELVEKAKTETDSTKKYGALDLARELATNNGDLATATAAVAAIAESFEIDVLLESVEALVLAAKTAESEAEVTALCEHGLPIVERCVALLDKKLLARAVAALRVKTKALPAGEGATRVGAALDEAPTKLRDLETAQNALSAAVVKWCDDHLGQSIDRGECWDVANQALRKSDADMTNCKDYVFGRLLGKKELAKPGDVLILKGVKARNWHTDAWHVAVIKAVDGPKLSTLHQNWSKNRTVHAHTFDVSTIVSGAYYVYRPVPKLGETK